MSSPAAEGASGRGGRGSGPIGRTVHDGSSIFASLGPDGTPTAGFGIGGMGNINVGLNTEVLDMVVRPTGDLVVALQQRLATFDPTVPIDGTFGASTEKALEAFQAARGIEPSGETDAATWQALIKLDLTPASWS